MPATALRDIVSAAESSATGAAALDAACDVLSSAGIDPRRVTLDDWKRVAAACASRSRRLIPSR